MERLAVIDGLTQIANRRRFDQFLQEQWESAENEISLIMLDIDFFKRFNDFYGHPEGDICLQQVARALASARARARMMASTHARARVMASARARAVL